MCVYIYMYIYIYISGSQAEAPLHVAQCGELGNRAQRQETTTTERKRERERETERKKTIQKLAVSQARNENKTLSHHPKALGLVA